MPMPQSNQLVNRRRFVGLAALSSAGAVMLAACGETATTTSAALSSAAPASFSPTSSGGGLTSEAGTTVVSQSPAATNTTAAAATATPKTPLKKLKFVLATSFLPSYVESYIAKAGGFWEKEGLDIELVAGSGTSTSIQQVSTKNAFAGRSGAITSVVSAGNAAVPLRSVYAIYQALNFVLITNDKRGIKGPNDLKGKNLGVVSRGGSTEQLLNLLLATVGIKPSEVNYLVVGSRAAAYAFLDSGKVDAFVATNADLIEFTFNQTPVVALPFSAYLKLPSEHVIVHQDSLATEAETVFKLLSGLHNAQKWALQQSQSQGQSGAFDKLVDYLGRYVPDELKNPPLLKLKLAGEMALWTGSSASAGASPSSALPANNNPLGQLDKAGWSSLTQQLLSTGLIPKPLELTSLIDTSVIDLLG